MFGVDLKLKLESDNKFSKAPSLLHLLINQHSLSLLSFPFKMKSVSKYRMSLVYNPQKSVTKEALLVMSFGKNFYLWLFQMYKLQELERENLKP